MGLRLRLGLGLGLRLGLGLGHVLAALDGILQQRRLAHVEPIDGLQVCVQVCRCVQVCMCVQVCRAVCV